MTAATYDPGSIIITFKGIPIEGFDDGDFVQCEKSEDTFTAKASADGVTVTRTHNRNPLGKVTVTLLAESPTNSRLDAIHASDIAFHDGIGELQIKDNVTNQILAEADEAWIMKVPNMTRGKESGAYEWVFECANLLIHALGTP